MPYPRFLPAFTLLSDFGSKVMIYLNLRRAPFSAVLKKGEKFISFFLDVPCLLPSLSLSLSIHPVIIVTAESGGLRPPGLASGRPPGSARGRPQGQVTTLGLLCLLPPPSPVPIPLHHDPCGDAGQLRRRNHYAKRNL